MLKICGFYFILIIVFLYFYGFGKCFSIGKFFDKCEEYLIVYIKYDLFIVCGSLGVNLIVVFFEKDLFVYWGVVFVYYCYGYVVVW